MFFFFCFECYVVIIDICDGSFIYARLKTAKRFMILSPYKKINVLPQILAKGFRTSTLIHQPPFISSPKPKRLNYPGGHTFIPTKDLTHSALVFLQSSNGSSKIRICDQLGRGTRLEKKQNSITLIRPDRLNKNILQWRAIFLPCCDVALFLQTFNEQSVSLNLQ